MKDIKKTGIEEIDELLSVNRYYYDKYLEIFSRREKEVLDHMAYILYTSKRCGWHWGTVLYTDIKLIEKLGDNYSRTALLMVLDMLKDERDTQTRLNKSYKITNKVAELVNSCSE